MVSLPHKFRHAWIYFRISGILGCWPPVSREEAAALGWELPKCHICGWGDHIK